MKWHGHTWKAGNRGWPEQGHYYPIVSADMPDGSTVPRDQLDANGNNPHARQAQFVSEWERDRIVKLWNATRHLDDDELDRALKPIEDTQNLVDIPGITLVRTFVSTQRRKI